MKNNQDQEKKFPEGMVPLGKSTFRFACHPGVSCFTQCCRKLDLFLYPYDIIRLKKRLGISSEEFLDKSFDRSNIVVEVIEVIQSYLKMGLK